MYRRAGASVAIVGVLAAAGGAGHAVQVAWDRVVVRSGGVPEPDRLVELVVERSAGPRPRVLFEREIRFLAREATAFEALGVWRPARLVLESGNGARSVLAASVDPGVLHLIGIPPALGRLLLPEDHSRWAAGDRVVVIGHELFRTFFGAAEGAVGDSVPIDGEMFRVLGVMPPGFVFPRPGYEAWIPAPTATPARFGAMTLQSGNAVGRLAPDVSPDAAAAEASALVPGAGVPGRTRVDVGVHRFTDQISASYRPALETTRFGVSLLFLLAAITAVILTVARSFRESGDAFIRWTVGGGLADEAMGAGGRVLILGALTAAAATALALGLGPLVGWTTRHLAPAGNVDTPVLISAGLLVAVIAVLGVAEAIALALRGAASRRRPRSRALPAVLLTLAATSATLTTSATVLLASGARGVLDGQGTWSGRNLVHLTVDFAGRGGSVPPEQALERLMRRLSLNPTVESAGYADHLPDTPRGSYLRGESVDGNERARVTVRRVSPNLFPTLGIPVVEGRRLLDSDAHPAEAVAVVDEALARRLGGESPVGRIVGSGSERYRVVGVIPEIRTFPQGEVPAVGALYSHFTHASHYRPPTTQVAVRLRETPTPDRLLELREAATAADPSLRVLRIETATRRRTAFLGTGALTALAVAVFGLAGLVMAVVAVLGQVRHDFLRRAREFAIRRALGASPARSQWEAVRPIVIATLGGALLGGVLAWIGAAELVGRFPWVEPPSPVQAALPGLLVAGFAGIGAWAFARWELRRAPWTGIRAD